MAHLSGMFTFIYKDLNVQIELGLKFYRIQDLAHELINLDQYSWRFAFMHTAANTTIV